MAAAATWPALHPSSEALGVEEEATRRGQGRGTQGPQLSTGGFYLP